MACFIAFPKEICSIRCPRLLKMHMDPPVTCSNHWNGYLGNHCFKEACTVSYNVFFSFVPVVFSMHPVYFTAGSCLIF